MLQGRVEARPSGLPREALARPSPYARPLWPAVKKEVAPVKTIRARPGGSVIAVAVTDPIEGFDLLKAAVGESEFPAHALDVAVNGAIDHIDMLAIGGSHQLVARFHMAR